MRYVIGIGGLKRSGKDSFARALREVAVERGLAFATVAFADALRQAAAAAYGVDVGIFTDDAKKDTVCSEWGITYRQMLLNLGVPATLLGGDHDHWVKRWRIEVQRTQAPWWGRSDDGPVTKQLDIVIAVPDVRRLNEAAAIHDAGGVNVLVQRPGVEWNGHVTEMLARLAATKAEGIRGDYNLYARLPELRQGTWHPSQPWKYGRSPKHFPLEACCGDRPVFDAQIFNDGDVAALRPHAERVLAMVLKGAK